MKKYILFIVICIMFLVASVSAEEYTGTIEAGSKISDVYIVKIDSEGNTTYKQGGFIIDSLTNSYVYCLEPFVNVDNSKTYNIVTEDYESALGISSSTWEYINLLAYYGYGYSDHTDDYWYYVTQVLIWRAVDPDSKIYFTDGLKGSINEELYSYQIKEIEALVASHYVTPSFNLGDMYIDDTYYLEDANNVLSNFTVTSNNASITNNTLVVTLESTSTIVTLEKTFSSNAVTFVSEESQNLLYGSNPTSVYVNLELNAYLKGSISLTKYTEDCNEHLEGVVFGLYDNDMNLLVEATTNEDGYILFSDLTIGTYYIKEISTIYGYILSDEVIQVDITLNSTKESLTNTILTLSNELYKGSITITKYGTDEYLEGVEFGLYDSTDNLIETLTTDSSGQVIFSDLTLGTYYVKELSTLDNYILDDTIYTFDITEETLDLTLDIYNELKEQLVTVKKIDADTSEALSDAVFSIYTIDDELVYTGVTDINGNFEVLLTVGTYIIKEILAPSGYELIEETYEFTVESDKDITITVKNKKIDIPDTEVGIEYNIVLYYKKKYE